MFLYTKWPLLATRHDFVKIDDAEIVEVSPNEALGMVNKLINLSLLDNTERAMLGAKTNWKIKQY